MAPFPPVGERFFGATVRHADLGPFRLTEKLHEPTEILPHHAHDRPYLSIVLTGGYREETATGATTCGAGTLVIHPPGEAHADVFGAHRSRLLVVEPILDRLEGTLRTAYEQRTVIQEAAAARLGGRLRTELQIGDPASVLVVQGLLLELAGRVLRLPSTAQARRPRWLIEARALVGERFLDGLGLDDLAAELGIHPSHLARQFRRAYGASVGEMVRGLRIEHAMELLASSRSLAEIAAECGFADQSHFTRCFRQVVGVPPGRYRRSGRRRASPVGAAGSS